METKPELRRRMRQEKNTHTETELLSRSEKVWRQVEALPEFRWARTVAVYWSLPDEVHTHDFVEKWSGEKTVLLPVMREGCDLELREYRPGCTMNAAEFCIREPEGEAFPLEHVDLILVPGMAFDRRGNRLGRGKGYYDRLLARMPAVKIGVCFAFQHLDHVPVDNRDVPMDRVVSA